MKKYTLLIFALMITSGCSGKVGDIVNLSRSVPDEFAVVKRKPLTVPPDFGLRPPEESDRHSKVALYDTRAEAQNALFGSANTETTAVVNLDAADMAFLYNVGESEPNIRRLIEQESTDLIHADRNFVKDLFRGLLPEEPPGKALDPVEAERRVKQTLLLSQQAQAKQGAITIERNNDSSFDWDSLWPF